MSSYNNDTPFDGPYPRVVRSAESGRGLGCWDWLEKALKPHGFVRVHKSYLVNLDRVREVRLRRGDDNDWELKLDPPVNSVLPVGREHVAGLRRMLGF